MPEPKLTPFLTRLMACNADDGTACGMAGMAEMRQAFSSADTKLKAMRGRQTKAEHFKLLRAECYGPPDLPLAPDRPTLPRPFAALTNEPLDSVTISTVVTIGTLVRLISRDDKKTLKKKGIRFATPSGPHGTLLSDHLAEKLVSRLSRLPVSDRRFDIADGESHGRPYVWFTPKADLDAALAARATLTHPGANVARDLLGLIHHGPTSWETGGANHLFALHMPASVAVRATHMRPAAPQAFDNRRFVLRFDAADLTGGESWGRTIDLEFFATRSTGAPIGGRERILLRLQAAIMPPGTKISFDYLGAVGSTRGEVLGRDDNRSFLKLIARGRAEDDLVEQMSG